MKVIKKEFFEKIYIVIWGEGGRSIAPNDEGLRSVYCRVKNSILGMSKKWGGTSPLYKMH